MTTESTYLDIGQFLMDTLFRNMMRQLNVALANMKVYAPDHPTTAAAIQRSYEALTQILEQKGEIALGTVENTLIVDESPADQSDTLIAKFVEELKIRDIDGLVFYGGISQEEFRVLLTCLNHDPDRQWLTGESRNFLKTKACLMSLPTKSGTER